MNLTASDKASLIKLASSLPAGSEERKAILKMAAYGMGPSRAELNRRSQERYLSDRATKCRFVFHCKAQEDLWNNELTGQISDGMWENSSNTSWQFWCGMPTAVGGATHIEGPVPDIRKTFNFLDRDLMDVVGDRMLEEIQKTEPSATEATLVKYLTEIKQAMSGAKIEAPAAPKPSDVANGLGMLLPDEAAEMNLLHKLRAACFTAAKIPFNISAVRGELFLFADSGSRAGQYHYFCVFSNPYGEYAYSAYGKVGGTPKIVSLYENMMAGEALKAAAAKAKAKFVSGYAPKHLKGITLEIQATMGSVKRVSP